MAGQQRTRNQQMDSDVDADRKKIELEEQLLNLQEKRLDLEQKRIELELRKLSLSSTSRKIKKTKSVRSSLLRPISKSADEWSDNEDRVTSSRHSLRQRHKINRKSYTLSEDESAGSEEDEGMNPTKSSDEEMYKDDSGQTQTEEESLDISHKPQQGGQRTKTLNRADSNGSHPVSTTSQSSADNTGAPSSEWTNISDYQRKSLLKNLETIAALSQSPRRGSEPLVRDVSSRTSSLPNTPVSTEKKDSRSTKVPRKAEWSREISKERVSRRSSMRGEEGKPNHVRERSADTRASTKTTKMSNESRGLADGESSPILDITSITVTTDASGSKQETPSEHKRTGYFVYLWPDGRQYSGEWLDGKFHGQGTYAWPNGGKYVGAYKNGLKHGSGIYEWADGNKYDGEFKNGRRHGRGLQLNEDGTVFHNGAWKDDEPIT